MPDFAMCATAHMVEVNGHKPCPRKESCRRNQLSGTEPGEWQSWAAWWRTWKDGDPMTCEGFMPMGGVEEGA